MMRQQSKQVKLLHATMNKQMDAFSNAVAMVEDKEKKAELLKMQKQITNAIEKGDVKMIQDIKLKLQSFADILNTK